MKKMSIYAFAAVFAVGVFMFSCTKEATKTDPIISATTISAGKQITSFKIINPAVTGVIDTINKTISLSMPAGTDVTSLTSEIGLGANLTISPASGTKQNYSSPVIYTVTFPDKSTSTWNVKIVFVSNELVDGLITKNTTWTKNGTYVIDGDLIVDEGAVLTIKPGTTIKFKAGAYIEVKNNATIIALGKKDSLITFTSFAVSPSSGDWNGIWFDAVASDNSKFLNCNILYAGISSGSAIKITGETAVAFDSCTISGSKGKGIVFDGENGTFSSFKKTKISGCVSDVISMNANGINTIDTSSILVAAAGTGILINNYNYNSSVLKTWGAHECPYIFNSGDLYFDGLLNIDAGAVFNFGANSSLTIGYSTNSTFNANGLPTKPIIFTTTALSNQSAGSWRGIWFGDNSDGSSLKHCKIKYAGTSSEQAIILYSTTISMEGCKISDSKGYGITVKKNYVDGGFSLFKNDTIERCANHLVSMYTAKISSIMGTANTGNKFYPSTGFGIEIYADANGDNLLATGETWTKQNGADFYITGEIYLNSGKLIIDKGCTFKMNTDASIIIGHDANNFATLQVNGDAGVSNTVTFTTASLSATPTKGLWKYIYFDYKTTESYLKYAVVNYAGSYPGSYGYGAVNVEGATVDLSGTVIKNSGTWGISKYDTSDKTGTYTANPAVVFGTGTETNVSGNEH